MKKHLIAVAVAAAVAAPAAMADTTLYGLGHLSLDVINAGAKNQVDGNSDKTNLNVQSASSRIGVKGSEKISSGLSALYQFEWAVDVADSGGLSARNQFVGLTGGFGTALLGRHDTPMKLAIAQYDLFTDQIGDNGNIVGAKYGLSAGWNLRPSNVIAYVTPNMAGFSATLAYVTDHDMRAGGNPVAIQNPVFDNADNNKFDAYSLSAGYKHKMFDITGAYEKHNADALSEKSWMLGAGVNFAGVRVNALYQDIKNFDKQDAKVYGAGASYTFGNNVVKAQYFTTDAEGKNGALTKDRSMWVVGYDYNLSKQTTVYAAYAAGQNGQGVWGDGHSPNTRTQCADNQDCSAFSVGVKHKF